MRRAPLIIITIAVVIIALVALNAASYIHESERATDGEARPVRSTHNAGATGVRALYDLLYESGERVVRWRESPAALLASARNDDGSRPRTFVVVGQVRVEFEDEEVEELLSWVEEGGRLVIIDRTPDVRLIPASEGGSRWSIGVEESSVPSQTVDARDRRAMTRGVAALAPGGMTEATRGVREIQPSRLASRLKLRGGAGGTIAPEETIETSDAPIAPPEEDSASSANTDDAPEAADAPPRPSPEKDGSEMPILQPRAPVAQFTDEQGGALLIEYEYGEGRVVLLSDPFIVSNNGIGAADNLHLALNIVRGSERSGVIAFDEFHQGYNTTRNETLAYFAGTPILAFALQFVLIALAVVWTRGRRLGRSVPLAREDRGSKLEFIASMAELQVRARAFDLAVENIYGRVRRALVRFGGARPDMPRAEIVSRVAARSGTNREQIESVMRECEEVVNGSPTNARRSLALIKNLRELERALGIQTRAREIKQAGKR